MNAAAAAALLERHDGAILVGALALLLWVPLPFGSHSGWAASLLGLAAFALWTAWWLPRIRGVGRPAQLDAWFLLPLALWLLWLGWIALQTVPWPASWIEALSPTRWQHARSAAELLGTALPDRLSPSIEVARTRDALWLSTAYLALFAVLAASLRERRHFRWLLWLLLLSGLAQALYGSLMVLSGLEYGAWGAKDAYRGYATGSFVNRNHFAGYLELCAAAALGLILSSPLPGDSRSGWRQQLRYWLDRAQDRRLFARVALAVLFAALILSQSRMGNVAAVAGLGLAAAALLLSRRRARFGFGLLLIGSVLLIDIWLFGRWFGLEQLAERYADASVDAGSRLDLLESLRPMLPAYATLGSGLGTFAAAFPQFRGPGIPGFVDHAHNDYAQFLIETGVVGALLVGALAVSTFVRALLILRRRRDPLVQGVAAAGIAAMAAIGVHSLADFNLQIPANAATLIALMAAVWASPTRSSRLLRSAATTSDPGARAS